MFSGWFSSSDPKEFSDAIDTLRAESKPDAQDFEIDLSQVQRLSETQFSKVMEALEHAATRHAPISTFRFPKIVFLEQFRAMLKVLLKFNTLTAILLPIQFEIKEQRCESIYALCDQVVLSILRDFIAQTPAVYQLLNLAESFQRSYRTGKEYYGSTEARQGISQGDYLARVNPRYADQVASIALNLLHLTARAATRGKLSVFNPEAVLRQWEFKHEDFSISLFTSFWDMPVGDTQRLLLPNITSQVEKALIKLTMDSYQAGCELEKLIIPDFIVNTDTLNTMLVYLTRGRSVREIVYNVESPFLINGRLEIGDDVPVVNWVHPDREEIVNSIDQMRAVAKRNRVSQEQFIKRVEHLIQIQGDVLSQVPAAGDHPSTESKQASESGAVAVVAEAAGYPADTNLCEMFPTFACHEYLVTRKHIQKALSALTDVLFQYHQIPAAKRRLVTLRLPEQIIIPSTGMCRETAKQCVELLRRWPVGWTIDIIVASAISERRFDFRNSVFIEQAREIHAQTQTFQWHELSLAEAQARYAQLPHESKLSAVIRASHAAPLSPAETNYIFRSLKSVCTSEYEKPVRAQLLRVASKNEEVYTPFIFGSPGAPSQEVELAETEQASQAQTAAQSFEARYFFQLSQELIEHIFSFVGGYPTIGVPLSQQFMHILRMNHLFLAVKDSSALDKLLESDKGEVEQVKAFREIYLLSASQRRIAQAEKGLYEHPQDDGISYFHNAPQVAYATIRQLEHSVSQASDLWADFRAFAFSIQGGVDATNMLSLTAPFSTRDSTGQRERTHIARLLSGIFDDDAKEASEETGCCPSYAVLSESGAKVACGAGEYLSPYLITRGSSSARQDSFQHVMTLWVYNKFFSTVIKHIPATEYELTPSANKQMAIAYMDGAGFDQQIIKAVLDKRVAVYEDERQCYCAEWVGTVANWCFFHVFYDMVHAHLIANCALPVYEKRSKVPGDISDTMTMHQQAVVVDDTMSDEALMRFYYSKNLLRAALRYSGRKRDVSDSYFYGRERRVVEDGVPALSTASSDYRHILQLRLRSYIVATSGLQKSLTGFVWDIMKRKSTRDDPRHYRLLDLVPDQVIARNLQHSVVNQLAALCGVAPSKVAKEFHYPGTFDDTNLLAEPLLATVVKTLQAFPTEAEQKSCYINPFTLLPEVTEQSPQANEFVSSRHQFIAMAYATYFEYRKKYNTEATLPSVATAEEIKYLAKTWMSVADFSESVIEDAIYLAEKEDGLTLDWLKRVVLFSEFRTFYHLLRCEVTRQMILSGAWIDAPDERQSQFIDRLVMCGDLTTFEFLKTMRVDIDLFRQNIHGECFLHTVAKSGIPRLVKDVVTRYQRAGLPLDVTAEDGLTPLGCALAHRARSSATLLLKAGANINFRIPGAPMWFKACILGLEPSADVLDLAINLSEQSDCPLDIFTLDTRNATLLYAFFAFAKNNLHNTHLTPTAEQFLVKLLDLYRARCTAAELEMFLNHVHQGGYSLAHEVTSFCSVEMTQRLVSMGLDLASPQSNGNTALHKIYLYHAEARRLLQGHLSDSDRQAKAQAAQIWLDMLAYLLTQVPDTASIVGRRGRLLLHDAIIDDNPAVVELLAGAHVSLRDTIDEHDREHPGFRPIHLALRAGSDISMFRFLVEHGAITDMPETGVPPEDNLTSSGLTPAWVAFLDGLLQTKKLREQKQAVSEEQVISCFTRFKELIQFDSRWIDCQIGQEQRYVNVRERDSLLHAAIRNRLPFSLLALILECGPNLALRNRMGRTPYHLACAHEHSGIPQVPNIHLILGMLKVDARLEAIDVLDDCGHSPFHRLLFGGRIDLNIIEEMLKAGVDINRGIPIRYSQRQETDAGAQDVIYEITLSPLHFVFCDIGSQRRKPNLHFSKLNINLLWLLTQHQIAVSGFKSRELADARKILVYESKQQAKSPSRSMYVQCLMHFYDTSGLVTAGVVPEAEDKCLDYQSLKRQVVSWVFKRAEDAARRLDTRTQVQAADEAIQPSAQLRLYVTNVFLLGIPKPYTMDNLSQQGHADSLDIAIAQLSFILDPEQQSCSTETRLAAIELASDLMKNLVSSMSVYSTSAELMIVKMCNELAGYLGSVGGCCSSDIERALNMRLLRNLCVLVEGFFRAPDCKKQMQAAIQSTVTCCARLLAKQLETHLAISSLSGADDDADYAMQVKERNSAVAIEAVLVLKYVVALIDGYYHTKQEWDKLLTVAVCNLIEPCSNLIGLIQAHHPENEDFESLQELIASAHIAIANFQKREKSIERGTKRSGSIGRKARELLELSPQRRTTGSGDRDDQTVGDSQAYKAYVMSLTGGGDGEVKREGTVTPPEYPRHPRGLFRDDGFVRAQHMLLSSRQASGKGAAPMIPKSAPIPIPVSGQRRPHTPADSDESAILRPNSLTWYPARTTPAPPDAPNGNQGDSDSTSPRATYTQ